MYVTVVEDRPIMSAAYRLALLAKTDLTHRAARSAIAELLVCYYYYKLILLQCHKIF